MKLLSLEIWRFGGSNASDLWYLFLGDGKAPCGFSWFYRVEGILTPLPYLTPMIHVKGENGENSHTDTHCPFRAEQTD